MATNQRGKWLILSTLFLLIPIGLLTSISKANQSPKVCTVLEPLKSIQTAIDDPTCDHIRIGEGEYYENLVIRRSLLIEGVSSQRTRIRGQQWDAPVIRIASDAQEIHVVLKGLSILEAKGNSQDDGIQIYGKSNVVLEQVSVKQNQWGRGILIRGGGQAILSSVTIADNGQGILVTDNAQVRLLQAQVVNNGGSGGLVVLNSAKVEIADSIFRGNGGSSFGAIVALDSAHVILTSSVLVSNGYGMRLENKASAYLMESFIVSNEGTGIVFVSQGHLAMRHSKIVGNALRGIAGYSGSMMLENSQITNNSDEGLSLYGSAKAIIVSTIISGNGLSGVTLGNSSRAKIKQAEISENGYRVAPWPFSGGIIMESESQLTLEESLINANAGWGLAQIIKDCFPLLLPVPIPDKFFGVVAGTPTNRFLYNGRLLPPEMKSNGDGVGDVCPKELNFLKGY